MIQLSLFDAILALIGGVFLSLITGSLLARLEETAQPGIILLMEGVGIGAMMAALFAESALPGQLPAEFRLQIASFAIPVLLVAVVKGLRLDKLVSLNISISRRSGEEGEG
jgi:hypothetical protein